MSTELTIDQAILEVDRLLELDIIHGSVDYLYYYNQAVALIVKYNLKREWFFQPQQSSNVQLPSHGFYDEPEDDEGFST
jgi:hypothetical protein